MPPVGFEPTISEGERPQTYALDRAATGTGPCYTIILQKSELMPSQVVIKFHNAVEAATSLAR